MHLSTDLSKVMPETRNLEQPLFPPPYPHGPGGHKHFSSNDNTYLWVSVTVIIIATVSVLVILFLFCRQRQGRQSNAGTIITHMELQNASTQDGCPDPGSGAPTRNFRVLKGENVIITVVEKY